MNCGWLDRIVQLQMPAGTKMDAYKTDALDQWCLYRLSSILGSRRGPLHCSNSMAMMDGTPPEFHWLSFFVHSLYTSLLDMRSVKLHKLLFTGSVKMAQNLLLLRLLAMSGVTRSYNAGQKWRRTTPDIRWIIVNLIIGFQILVLRY